MGRSLSVLTEGVQRLGDTQDSGGDKHFDLFSSPSSSEKNSKMTAFKKIGFSARRALKLVSRSIDNRGVARSGSDGAVSCVSQALGDSSPLSPTPALSHQLSTDSLNTSLPSRRDSMDLNVYSPRLKESCRPAPPAQPLPLQEQSGNHPLPPAPPAAAPCKPRSLLSALLKRPITSTAAAADNSAKQITALASSPRTPTQLPPQPPPPPSACHQCPPASGSPQPYSSSPLAPQPSCSLGRLYESMPTQNPGSPAPHSLLVPPRPYPRGTPAERMDLCLSAPSPHMASLRHAMMKVERTDGCASSAPKSSALEAARVASAAAAVRFIRAEPKEYCPSPHEAGCRAPPPFVTVGADGTSPAATSIPATSLLASSLGGDCVGRCSFGPRSSAGPAAAAVTAATSQPPQEAAVAAATAAAAAMAAGQSLLLAVSGCTPPAMLRSCWSMEDYSLQKRLYKGKMSSVYKGRCLRSGLPVALKVYFKARVPSNVVHMVMREVSIHLLASEHKNALKLYGVFQTEEVAVMVMELASRGNLSSICQNVPGGRLNEVQVRQTVLEPLLDALSFLHGKGVCHRDIKPENLLFTSDWGFRLADFGVSINLLEERAVTRAGTADYMAPEVERCPLKVHPDENKENETFAYTTAADVWSVGVLAYELLVGFPPVVGRGAPSFPASVSPGARAFITAALAHLAEERPTVRQLRCHPWMVAGTAGATATTSGGGGSGGEMCRWREIQS